MIAFILLSQFYICAAQPSCTGYYVIYMHNVLLPFPTNICAQNGRKASFKFHKNGEYTEYASTDCNSATVTNQKRYESGKRSTGGSSDCEYAWSYLTVYENENILYRYPLITDTECITWVKLKCLSNTNDLEQYEWDDTECSGDLESHAKLSEVISIFDVSNYTTRTRELKCNVYEPPLVSTVELAQILVGCGLLLCCIFGCFCCYKCKKRQQKKRDAYFQQKAMDLNQNANVDQYVHSSNVNNNVSDVHNQNVVMVQMPNGQMVAANILPNVVPVVPLNNDKNDTEIQVMQEGQQVVANNEERYTLQ